GHKSAEVLPKAPPDWKALSVLAAAGFAWTIPAWVSTAYSLRAQDRRLRALSASAKQFDPAARLAEAAVGHHPADYGSHLLAAAVFGRFGNAHAMRHLNVAMVLNPMSPTPHLAAARALAASGRRDQAALEYRTAFEQGWPMYDVQLNEL